MPSGSWSSYVRRTLSPGICLGTPKAGERPMTRRIHAEAPARLHILLIASVAMVWWMNGWTLAAVLTGLCVFLPLLLRDRKTSSAPILCQPSQEAVPVEVACFWVRPDPADFGVEVRIARIWTDCGDGSNVPAADRTERSVHRSRPSASTSGRRTKRHQPSARTATRPKRRKRSQRFRYVRP